MKQLLFPLLSIFFLNTVSSQDINTDEKKQQVTIKEPIQTSELEVYYMPPVGPESRNIRNSDVDFPASTYTIPVTGTYLVILNASAVNNATYSTLTAYDETGFIYLKKTSSKAGIYSVMSDFFAKYVDGTPTSSIMRYVPLPVSRSAVIRFTAGEIIRVGARVSSRGTPTYTWNVNYIQVVLVKLR